MTNLSALSEEKWKETLEAEVSYWKKFHNWNTALASHHDFFDLIYTFYCKTLHTTYFKRILEIGIGASGGFLSVIGNAKIKYALDPLVDELDSILPYKNKIKYHKGVGEELPFEDNSFGLVIIANALDHCKDMAKVVSEIKRVLATNGKLLFMTYFDNDKFHAHSFHTPQDVRNLIGMEIAEEHYVQETNRFKNRNPYYVAVFKK